MMTTTTRTFLPACLLLCLASAAPAISPCGTFQAVEAPALTPAVAATGNGSLWGIGASSGDDETVVLHHFDGQSWAEQSLPPDVEGFDFAAAATEAGGDAWFSATRVASAFSLEFALLRVRDGAVDRVDILSLPNGPGGPGAPVDASAASDQDVWLLTAAGDVLHFDGTAWSHENLPPVYPADQRLYPQAIHVVAPDDVWVVGYGGPGRATYIGYTQHWDGSSWNTVATPMSGQDQTFFLDIDSTGPDDLRIVGHADYSQAIFLEWTGSAWVESTVDGSAPAIAAVLNGGPLQAWALPTSSATGEDYFYWDGTAWDALPLPGLPAGATVTWRRLVGAGDCEAWAFGSYSTAAGPKRLAIRLLPDGGNRPPVARIGLLGADSGPAPWEVAFTSAGSDDPDGWIVAWHWDFGDGTTSTAAEPGVRVYGSPGIYTAALTVTDNEGATASATIPVTVLEPACQVDCLRIIDPVTFRTRPRSNDPQKVQARIIVRDEHGAPVDDVLVQTIWELPDGTLLPRSRATNRRGLVRFNIRVPSGSLRLQILDLLLAGHRFDPANSVLEASIVTPAFVR